MDKKLLISFAILVIVIFLFLKHNKSSSFGNSKKTNKVALIIHVGNIKVFKQILKNYPKFFNNNNIDLYISCNNTKDFDILQKTVPDAELFKYENRGMDIGPFLLMIKHLIKINANYNYYIKIHTKSDASWRNLMIKPIYDNLNYFLDYPSKGSDSLNSKGSDSLNSKGVKMYGCYEYTYDGQFDMNYTPVMDIIRRNYPEYIENFLEYCSRRNKIGIECKKSPYFVAGTIFAFNDVYFDLFKKIVDLNHEYMILETGYIVNDVKNPRKTHAWEYFFGYLVYLNNENIITL